MYCLQFVKKGVFSISHFTHASTHLSFLVTLATDWPFVSPTQQTQRDRRRRSLPELLLSLCALPGSTAFTLTQKLLSLRRRGRLSPALHFGAHSLSPLPLAIQRPMSGHHHTQKNLSTSHEIHLLHVTIEVWGFGALACGTVVAGRRGQHPRPSTHDIAWLPFR
ncbi:hypothetical protein BS50DRAFT_286763 [Corynespora cassiicola Philippines]|uniref:Uncharacterized protein n=1 Tax=Corynespora cassiicola Philippines TaxID=1448308 RepID=A0A2T2P266_CORCC|nr:hypothetical protein BS50DRAFT_286763 [Corynespora cassiicola Philippines]